MRKFGMVVGLCVLLVLAASTCFAAPAKPRDKVVLTVSGAINTKNSDKGFEFDMEMLENLGVKNCDVRDPWLGNKKYAGVVISDILNSVGAAKGATEIIVVAKDGKSITIKAEDVAKYPIMLATKDGGKAIGSGVGGPVKLVFPYGTSPELEKVYDKNCWNWFVVALEVK